MRGIPRILAAALVMAGILMSTRAYAQGGATGAISGVVVDTSGGVGGAGGGQSIATPPESRGRHNLTNTDRASLAAPPPPGAGIGVGGKHRCAGGHRLG